ncbi:glycosyltransferase, partial [Patescibacteria group bacterium]|nr:glycosyltransferase [Patescibacteria group bacterium]
MEQSGAGVVYNTLMTKPFFSIIIPSLNEEKYLPHLLSDLADQSFQDFEVIVVDGHSDDNTVKTAKTFSRRLSLKIVNSSRRHVCVQRNLGAKSAKADTFIFMDADNRLPPYFLQGIKYRLESSPADIATCWLQSDHDSTKDKNISLAINYAHELLKNSKAPIMMESLVISSHQAFHKIGGFDENVNLGEGTFFTKQALTNHFTYSVYRDPI